MKHYPGRASFSVKDWFTEVHARTIASKTWRRMSLSRKQPWRLTENVE